MFKNHLKRLVSIVLCIACLVPAMTSLAAVGCPRCKKGSLSIVRVEKKVRCDNVLQHTVITTTRHICGYCGYSIAETKTIKQMHSMGEWKPDGSVDRSTCAVCGFSITRPRTQTTPPSVTIYDAFGRDNLRAPMQDSNYVSNMKNAIRAWALEHNKTGLATITELDGGDRNFGTSTEEAVKLFQSLVGLDADGIVGPATKEVLLPYCSMVL